MKKKLRRIFSFLLLLCISIGSLSFLQFNVGQLSCKINAALQQKEKHNLTRVKIAAKDFATDKDEVWVGDNLYDVNSYVIVDDTAILSVRQDKNEEQLINSVVSLFQTNEQYTRSDHHTQVSKYRPYIPDGKILNANEKTEQNLFACAPVYSTAGNCAVVNSGVSNVIKPPPRA